MYVQQVSVVPLHICAKQWQEVKATLAKKNTNHCKMQSARGAPVTPHFPPLEWLGNAWTHPGSTVLHMFLYWPIAMSLKRDGKALKGH